jgi:type IV pilus assembly protein PilX
MVLITSLVILVVLTLFGLAAVQNTMLEERMAGNLRSENVALQAAEAALREGEGWLTSLVSQPIPVQSALSGNTPYVWQFMYPATLVPGCGAAATCVEDYRNNWWRFWTGAEWSSAATLYTAANPLVFAVDVADPGKFLSAPRPRYVIEESRLQRDSIVVGQQQDNAGKQFYQITGLGADASGRGEVLIRSSFARRF